jgi:hypothetical protein
MLTAAVVVLLISQEALSFPIAVFFRYVTPAVSEGLLYINIGDEANVNI